MIDGHASFQTQLILISLLLLGALAMVAFGPQRNVVQKISASVLIFVSNVIFWWGMGLLQFQAYYEDYHTYEALLGEYGIGTQFDASLEFLSSYWILLFVSTALMLVWVWRMKGEKHWPKVMV